MNTQFCTLSQHIIVHSSLP